MRGAHGPGFGDGHGRPSNADRGPQRLLAEQSHHVSGRTGSISYIGYARHLLLYHLKLFLCICHIVGHVTHSWLHFLGFRLWWPIWESPPKVGLKIWDLMESSLGDQGTWAFLEKVIFEALVDGGFDGVRRGRG